MPPPPWHHGRWPAGRGRLRSQSRAWTRPVRGSSGGRGWIGAVEGTSTAPKHPKLAPHALPEGTPATSCPALLIEERHKPGEGEGTRGESTGGRDSSPYLSRRHHQHLAPSLSEEANGVAVAVHVAADVAAVREKKCYVGAEEAECWGSSSAQGSGKPGCDSSVG